MFSLTVHSLVPVRGGLPLPGKASRDRGRPFPKWGGQRKPVLAFPSLPCDSISLPFPSLIIYSRAGNAGRLPGRHLGQGRYRREGKREERERERREAREKRSRGREEEREERTRGGREGGGGREQETDGRYVDALAAAGAHHVHLQVSLPQSFLGQKSYFAAFLPSLSLSLSLSCLPPPPPPHFPLALPRPHLCNMLPSCCADGVFSYVLSVYSQNKKRE